MSRGRKFIVNTLVAGLLTGSMFDIVANREHWPFSPYTMYATLEPGPSLTTLRLFGVTETGAELPLLADEHIAPFDPSRLRWALDTVAAGPDGKQRLRLAVGDCLRRYEERRREGKHAGPPLVAVRLYRLYWTLDAEARNVDHPDNRQIVSEARLSEVLP